MGPRFSDERLSLGRSILDWLTMSAYALKRYVLDFFQKRRFQNQFDSYLLKQLSEIRRPLHGLIGTQDLFAIDYGNPQVVDYVEVVNHCGQHIIEKINRLQFFTDLSKGEFPRSIKVFSASTVFDQVMEDITRANPGSHLQVKIKIDKSLRNSLRGGQALMTSLLKELTSNAIKFSKNRECEITLLATGDPRFPIRLSVTNPSPGIPTSVCQIQKLNWSGTSHYLMLGKEAGLGLAMIQEICSKSGSRLRLDFPEGTLVRFTIDFPAGFVSPHAQSSGRVHADSNGLQEILVVEDEPLARNLMAAMLTRLGYQATFCQNGAEAIDLCSKRDFGIILMDIEMPKIDGWSATQSIFEIYNTDASRTRPAIIALSAVHTFALAEKAQKLGFSDFLTKPLGLERLSDLMCEYGVFPTDNGHKKSEQRAPEWEEPTTGYAINLNKLYDHFGEDLSICQIVLKESSEHLPKLFDQVITAHEQRQFTELRGFLHKLQGEFAILMADKGVTIAKRMSGRQDYDSVEFLSDLEDLTSFMEILLTEVSMISHEKTIAAS